MLADTLLHEAAHQLVEQRLFGGRKPPIWLTEGLASYFGYMKIDRDGSFRPEAIGSKAVQLLKDAERPNAAEAAARLKAFKQSTKGGEATPFAEILAIRDWDHFYGRDVTQNYTASWLLVHFLMHGEGGAHVEAFGRWIASGPFDRDAESNLLRELGMTGAELDAAAKAHARKLKAK